MGGVQRTTKFVKYLNHFGWKPIVITSSPKLYYAFDFEMLNELKDIEIVRTDGEVERSIDRKEIKFKNEKLRNFFSKLSQIFLVPDTKILWEKKAIRYAEKIINSEKINLIFSTAPPYTDFLVGYELSKKYDIPLVLDYRDDWIECPYNFYFTPFHKRLHLKLERKILNYANAFITINYKIQNLIFDRYPEIDIKDSEVIPQGYDPDDFINAKDIADKLISEKKKFRFCYSGSFFNLMTPEFFLKGLQLAFLKKPELKNKIEMFFVGIFPEKFIKLINDLELKDNIVLTGYLKHLESTAYLLTADVLWMMIGKSSKSFMISTGKLFEYIGTGKPILASVPGGAARDILSAYGAEFITDPDDINDLSEKIIHLYELYEQNKLPVGKKDFIDKFNRKYLTQKLVDIFNKVCI